MRKCWEQVHVGLFSPLRLSLSLHPLSFLRSSNEETATLAPFPNSLKTPLPLPRLQQLPSSTTTLATSLSSLPNLHSTTSLPRNRRRNSRKLSLTDLSLDHTHLVRSLPQSIPLVSRCRQLGPLAITLPLRLESLSKCRIPALSLSLLSHTFTQFHLYLPSLPSVSTTVLSAQPLPNQAFTLRIRD